MLVWIKKQWYTCSWFDDDELNPLKYYEDSNFKDVGLSPPTKRKHSEPDNTRKLKVRKKKNIFSIE